MGTPFASGKYALGICDLCGFQYKLLSLKPQIVKQKPTGLLVCSSCLDQDHPQLMLGSFKFDDPQALQNPRPDTGQAASRVLTGTYP
jgi:hypothetical protein